MVNSGIFSLLAVIIQAGIHMASALSSGGGGGVLTSYGEMLIFYFGVALKHHPTYHTATKSNQQNAGGHSDCCL